MFAGQRREGRKGRGEGRATFHHPHPFSMSHAELFHLFPSLSKFNGMSYLEQRAATPCLYLHCAYGIYTYQYFGGCFYDMVVYIYMCCMLCVYVVCMWYIYRKGREEGDGIILVL